METALLLAQIVLGIQALVYFVTEFLLEISSNLPLRLK